MKNPFRVIPNPHLLIILDFGLIGFRAGLAYFDINNDAFRPAFFEVIVWNRWRVSFELGRIQSLMRTR